MIGTRSAITITLGIALLGGGCGSGDDTVSVATIESTPAPSSTTATSGEADPVDAAIDTGPAPVDQPDLATIDVDLVEIGVFDQPVGLAYRPGDDAIYVVEQSGRIIRSDSGRDETVADVRDLTAAGGERGLLGLAFSVTGDLAYLNHTDLDGDTVVAEYAVDEAGVFDPASRRILIEIPQPYGNHNGGHLVIDDAGRLLIGMGDGGSGGDPERRSLAGDDLLGKILRIDPRPDESAGLPYRIPSDNPYADGVDGRPEILVSGVRNPWKFTIDPATGDLWVADVGQGEVEEATRVPAAAIAGASLGWSAFEGDQRYNDDQPADGHLPPTLTYRHGDDGCSISGGAVYRGAAIPGLVGAYVFGDFCSGRVVATDIYSGASLELARPSPVAGVLPGPDGELYVIAYGGEIWKIVPR